VRNLAAAEAEGEVLAFVDADNELATGWVPAALGALQDVSVTAVGDHYHAPNDGPWCQQMYDKLRTRVRGSGQVSWLGSGNLVVRRSAFEAVGGFDAALETCEDVDLCQRLTARGGRIVAVEAMVNVHHGDPRTLKALFVGELWRGRDNLRVSLRAPLTVRSLPGLAIPVLALIALAVVAAGAAAWPWGGLWIAGVGVVALGLLVLPHAVLIVMRTPHSERSAVTVARALLFSAVYNLARALALVARAGHGTRRTE
jgi:hypothetical protein